MPNIREAGAFVADNIIGNPFHPKAVDAKEVLGKSQSGKASVSELVSASSKMVLAGVKDTIHLMKDEALLPLALKTSFIPVPGARIAAGVLLLTGGVLHAGRSISEFRNAVKLSKQGLTVDQANARR